MAPGQGCEPPADCLPALAGAQPPPCASHQAQKPLLSASHSTNTPPLPNRYYAINRHKATTLTPSYHAGARAPRPPARWRAACRWAATCAHACAAPITKPPMLWARLAPYPLQSRTAPMTTASTTASSCTTSGAVPIGSAAHVQTGRGTCAHVCTRGPRCSLSSVAQHAAPTAPQVALAVPCHRPAGRAGRGAARQRGRAASRGHAGGHAAGAAARGGGGGDTGRRPAPRVISLDRQALHLLRTDAEESPVLLNSRISGLLLYWK